MSASQNQAAETSKDADDRKVDHPWNIIHIRLPPRKRLSDASLILSKRAPGNSSNTGSKEVSEPVTDNPGKNLITASVQGDANCHSPRDTLCNEADSNIMSKSLSAESESDTSGNKLLDGAKVSSLSKNLRVAAEEQGSDASSYAAKDGLCEEANNNNPGMILPLAVQELPNDSTPSKNLRVAAEDQGSNASSYAGLSEEANNSIPSMIIPVPVQELPEDHIDNSRSKNLATTSKQGKDEQLKSPRKKLIHDIDSKVGDEEGNYPSLNPTVTAVKYEKVFEEANRPIACQKLSDEARNNGPGNGPTDLANNRSVYKRRRTSSVQGTCTSQSPPRKKPRTSPVQATGTSQNKSITKTSTSDGQAVNQSKSAADLEAIKQYQEFEEKVKRTVYLDNLSDQATEEVIKAALSQFCSIRKISFVVNYTIPYNIPQSALVEMETEKDAEVVVSMLHDFPFMMSGMPRPVRAIRATAEMFHDRRRRPGSKLNFHWVDRTDPDYETLKKLKLLSRKQEVENFALIEHELEEEKSLAAKQQENLDCNYKMMAAMDSVLLSGMSKYISDIYNVGWNDLF